jgi:photosystem II stability/assembly factor-like uncharacterized protein
MDIPNHPMRALRIAVLFVLSGGSTFGANWSESNTGLPVGTLGVRSLTVDPLAPSTIYALSNNGGVFKSTDGAGSWRMLGGIAGASYLVLDRKVPSTIYASTSHGIVKSTNGGEGWTRANFGLTGYFTGPLVIDPITSSTIYVVSPRNGVFKSMDGGASWNVLSTRVPRDTFNIVLDPVTPSTIYALTNRGISKSTDEGENWSVMDIGLPLNTPVFTLAIDPTNAATLYTGYSDRSVRGVVIKKSTDGGKSWNVVDAAAGRSGVSITVDPVTPSTLYVTYVGGPTGGFIRSTDGSETWEAIDGGLPAGNSLRRCVAIDPATPSTIYTGYYDDRASGGGLFKSTTRGTDWSQADAGLSDIDIRTLAIHSSNTAIIYAGGRDGVFKSVDGGANWSKLIAFQLSAPIFPPPLSPPPFGAGPAHPRSLVISSVNPNVLYALTWRYNACAFSDKLIFKSIDGGAAWTDSASPPFSGCLLGELMVLDPADPNTIYVAEAEDGWWLLKSTDGGANWNTIWDWTRGMESALRALAIDPTNSSTLYAGMGNFGQTTFGSNFSGLMKSTDGGESWVNLGLTQGAVTVLAINPVDPRVLYAATEDLQAVPPGFRGLFKSTDSGASWFPINDGLESLINTRYRISALVISRVNPNLLYAGTAGAGVLRSVDGGATWTPFNDGLANLDIRVLALGSGEPKTLYAGTPGGVFKIVDEGGSL